MQINGSIPFQVARAYGTIKAQQPPCSSCSDSPAAPFTIKQTSAIVRAADAYQSTQSSQAAAIQSLVAGQVNRPIDFMPAAAAQSESLQLYTRSADRIEAATAVQIGRSLDVSG